jgi:hypothetical protein
VGSGLLRVCAGSGELTTSKPVAIASGSSLLQRLLQQSRHL